MLHQIIEILCRQRLQPGAGDQRHGFERGVERVELVGVDDQIGTGHDIAFTEQGVEIADPHLGARSDQRCRDG